jgi:hypothetical protein
MNMNLEFIKWLEQQTFVHAINTTKVARLEWGFMLDYKKRYPHSILKMTVI